MERLTQDPAYRLADRPAGSPWKTPSSARARRNAERQRRERRRPRAALRSIGVALLLAVVSSVGFAASAHAAETVTVTSLGFVDEWMPAEGLWQAQVEGTVAYDCTGNCSAIGKLLNADCFITDELHPGGLELPSGNGVGGKDWNAVHHYPGSTPSSNILITGTSASLTCPQAFFGQPPYDQVAHSCMDSSNQPTDFRYRGWVRGLIRLGATRFLGDFQSVDGMSRCTAAAESRRITAEVRWLNRTSTNYPMMHLQVEARDGDDVVHTDIRTGTALIDFGRNFEEGWTYKLTVLSPQGGGQTCMFRRGAGTVGGSDIQADLVCGEEWPMTYEVCGLPAGEEISLRGEFVLPAELAGPLGDRLEATVRTGNTNWGTFPSSLRGVREAKWKTMIVGGDPKRRCTPQMANGVVGAASPPHVAISCSAGLNQLGSTAATAGTCNTPLYDVTFAANFRDILVGGGSLPGPGTPQTPGTGTTGQRPVSVLARLDTVPSPGGSGPPVQFRLATQNGRYPFHQRLPDGAGYFVTVAETSPGLMCNVFGGSGTVQGAPVDDVTIDCEQPVTPQDWCDLLPELCVSRPPECEYWWRFEGRTRVSTYGQNGELIGIRITDLFTLQKDCVPGVYNGAATSGGIGSGPLVYLRSEFAEPVPSSVRILGVARHDGGGISGLEAYLDGNAVAVHDLQIGAQDPHTCDEVERPDCDRNSAFSFRLEGMSPGEHTLVVKATAADGQAVPGLNQMHFTVEGGGPGGPPAPPASVTASDGAHPDRIDVAWPASSGATSYRVHRSPSPSTGFQHIATRTGLSFADSGLSAGQAFYYRIKACDATGCSALSTSDRGSTSSVGGSPPAAPTSVWASDGLHPDRIQVSWTAMPLAVGYRVYRHHTPDEVHAGWIGTVTSGTTYTDGGMVEGQVYYYWVRSENDRGLSGFSPVDQGSTSSPTTPPPVPSEVFASDGTFPDRVLVTWVGSAEADSYQVFRGVADDPQHSVQIATGVSALEYWDTGGTVGQLYRYWVKAQSAGGVSAASSEDVGYSGSLPSPVAPGWLTATDGQHADRIELAWGAVSAAVSYEVYRSTSSSSGTALRIASGVTGTAYTDEGLATGQTFYYWAKACNANGCSALSPHDAGSTAAPAPPAPPSSLSASDAQYPDRIVINWPTVSGATWYELYRHHLPNSGPALRIALRPSPGYTDGGMVEGQVYYYWVRACNDTSCSDLSDYDRGSTSEPTTPPPVPTFVFASDGTFNDRVLVTWVGSAEADHYDIFRGFTADPSQAIFIANGVRDPQYWDTTMSVGPVYYYFVRAENTAGPSALSDPDAGHADPGGGPGFP